MLGRVKSPAGKPHGERNRTPDHGDSDRDQHERHRPEPRLGTIVALKDGL
jgi:hypothetical protein